MGRKKIPQPKPSSSSGQVGLASYSIPEDSYPVFCFRHLHSKHNIEFCINADKKFLKGFTKKLETLSKLTWKNIQLTNRKGLGTEKIAKTSIIPSIPCSITRDVQSFLSFYFAGEKGRIIGYKGAHNIFHIVYIDTKLSVYKH